ncbi:hypothetical protein [Streptomyces flavofungini]|uniref:hypothetical protein n=1 Tax=Streptomyces flavofungini TaxID=68200 RepID=UPI0034DE7539
MHASAQSTTTITTFQQDDFVLYRSPSLFWTGKAGHTFVCRVERCRMDGRYDLTAVATGDFVPAARPEYMRLLSSADAMADIDTAPLRAGDAADGMNAAALAWLTQQHTTVNQSPLLPGQQA